MVSVQLSVTHCSLLRFTYLHVTSQVHSKSTAARTLLAAVVHFLKGIYSVDSVTAIDWFVFIFGMCVKPWFHVKIKYFKEI